jgi:outer membrane protein insertion porin family
VIGTVTKVSTFAARATAGLLAGTMLSTAAFAQTAPAQAPAATAAAPAAAPVAPPVQRTIKTLRVDGSQRIEPETVLSYTKLRPGIAYTNESLDEALRDLLNSDLFADVSIAGVETGDIVINVRENPIINRVVFEGNKALKTDKIEKEVKLKPRQIFTRPAVQQDVARIVELYRRQGRFAANIEPKMVNLDQNRVDVIFEISEGAKSKVRKINILGNEKFGDGKLKEEMATKEARITRFFSSSTSYDQDRLAYDQQKLRQFYLTQGYADFRVVSAVAELTPDKKDFIITYVVEEGPRYKFGDVTVDSSIRDFNNDALAKATGIKAGTWFNAKQVEDTVEKLGETAGAFGYAFTEVNPEYNRNAEDLTMAVNFRIAEAKRSYVERVDITGNTVTQDKVVRREMRLAEGDAFNSLQVKRSTDRINSLGYFQDKFEVKETAGSSPDRIVLEAPLEERATGELQLSAGYSSLERFLIQASIAQRNFRGKGQTVRASVNYSSYSKSVELGFTEPYLFDKAIALGGDIFRRDYSAFSFSGNDRNTTYSQTSTGFQVRAAVPLTEYWSIVGRYGLSYDEVDLDKSQYYTAGVCDPLRAGRYLCDSIGNRLTSSIGYSLVNDSLNSRLRPTAGQRLVFSQDFAGLGGEVKYLKTRIEGDKYWPLPGGFVFSIGAEGGYIKSLEKSRGPGIDRVRITDRFYLGEPQFRGFDIRGVGPRVQRIPYITDPSGKQVLSTDRKQIADDALGGRAYYLGRAELEIPLPAGARDLGLRPSIFVDAGALFGLRRPLPTATFPVDANGVVQPLVTNILDSAGRQIYIVPVPADGSTDPNAGLSTTCATGFSSTFGGACSGTSVNTAATNSTPPFLERYLGNTWKPRLSVGFGVNWNSPFGPLRIDVAKALLKQKGEDDKLITFNVGTQF